MLENNADVNAKTEGGSYIGETPLHVTALSGYVPIAEFLLASGADIDVKDQYEHTPLRRAVDRGNFEMAELLINKGAQVTTRDTSGVTPLHLVARTDNLPYLDQHNGL